MAQESINGQDSIELFALTAEETSAIKQAFQTVIAEAAAAQQEYEQAAEPLQKATEEKKQKLWAEYKEAAGQFQVHEENGPYMRHLQAVKPLKDKISSVAESFTTQLRALMESMDNRLPAQLDCGLNGEAVHYDEIAERQLGAMVGPVEIAQYNIEKCLVPHISEADWVADRELQKPLQELSDKRSRVEHDLNCELNVALIPLREKLGTRLAVAKSSYDKTVQDLMRGAMLRAGIDVTGIRLDRQILEDDDY